MASRIEPRDYQMVACDKTESMWSAGNKSLLIVQPTGTGKTVTAAEIVRRKLVQDPSARVLFLAHREVLLEQAASAFRMMCPGTPIGWERQGRECSEYSQIVFGMFQSCARRLDRLSKTAWDLVVVDEAHRSRAESFEEVIRRVTGKNSRRLGLTATPKRFDGAGLDRLFDAVSFSMEIDEARDLGWLVPLRQQIVRCKEMDLTGVGMLAGDFHKTQLRKQLLKELVLKRMVDTTVRTSDGRQTIVFASDVEHVEAMGAEFVRRGIRVGSVTSKKAKGANTGVIDRFKRADLQVLIGVDILSEGFDCPDCDVGVMARPTLSQVVHIQQVGRILRPVKPPAGKTPEERRQEILNSIKPHAIVIDFCGRMKKHRLSTSGDFLAGEYTEEEHIIAQRIAEEIGGPVDMREMLEEAKKRLRKWKESKRNEARQRLIEQRHAVEKRQMITLQQKALDETDAVYGPSWKDNRVLKAWRPCPFLVLNIPAVFVEKRRQEGIRNDDQELRLAKAGLRAEDYDHLDRYARDVLIDVLRQRWARQQCTFRQAEMLFRFGYPVHMSRLDASRKITEISENDYQRPRSDGPIRNFEFLLNQARLGTVSWAEGRPVS